MSHLFSLLITQVVNSSDWMTMGEQSMDGYKDLLSESEVYNIIFKAIIIIFIYIYYS